MDVYVTVLLVIVLVLIIAHNSLGKKSKTISTYSNFIFSIIHTSVKNEWKFTHVYTLPFLQTSLQTFIVYFYVSNFDKMNPFMH